MFYASSRFVLFYQMRVSLPGILNVLKSLFPPMLLIMMPRAKRMMARLTTLAAILQISFDRCEHSSLKYTQAFSWYRLSKDNKQIEKFYINSMQVSDQVQSFILNVNWPLSTRWISQLRLYRDWHWDAHDPHEPGKDLEIEKHEKCYILTFL